MRTSSFALSVILIAALAGCTPLNIAPTSATSARPSPSPGPRIGVPRPDGWSEVDRPDIFEAAVTEFVHPPSESKIVVTTLQPADSPAIEATGLLSEYARNGWETSSIATGKAAFTMTKGERTIDVRVVEPDDCPGSMRCVVIFEGCWPSSMDYDFGNVLNDIQKRFVFLP